MTDLIVTNPSIIVPKGCPFRVDKENMYKCFLPYYYARVLDGPLLIIESEYDKW